MTPNPEQLAYHAGKVAYYTGSECPRGYDDWERLAWLDGYHDAGQECPGMDMEYQLEVTA